MISRVLLHLVAAVFFIPVAASQPGQPQKDPPPAPQAAAALSPQISIRADKGIYRGGERPVFRGRMLLGPGNPASGFVRVRVFQQEKDDKGKVEGKPVHDNIVEVKSGEFTDDSFVVQIPRESKDYFSTQRVGYWVEAEGITATSAVSPPTSHTNFSAEEVGAGGTLALIAIPLAIILYILFLVFPPFMQPMTKKAARSMLTTIYVLALVFLILPLLFPLLISVSSDLELILRTTPVGFLKATTGTPEESQWVINIGGVPAAAGLLRGGVGIPLLVLVLSMLGAAINMLRRLPDFLKIYDSIPETYEPGKDPHAGDQLRGELLRYFVYILSAPFIAMIAYSFMMLADYKNAHAIAIVAFSVGFISDVVVEAILDKARKMFAPQNGDAGKKEPGKEKEPGKGEKDS